MRAFVAVDVPPGAVTDGRLPPAPDHLTLRFFADLAPESLPGVVDAMSVIARDAAPFRLTIAGIGAFPSSRDPKVVWRGITDGREPLLGLAAALDHRLAMNGLPADPRPFVPHLTWFRVRSERDRTIARDLLVAGAGPPARSFAVDAIVLKESSLTRDGAIHRTVVRAVLAGPRRED